MRRLGSLNCIEVLNSNTNSSGEETWIILFHGYGADANDLSSLTDVVTTPANTNWLFPNGTLEVPIGPGWAGRAWWPIDILALQKAQITGEPREMSESMPPNLPQVRQKAFEAIAALNIPWKNIVLGGFSQGAMLATDLYLHAPETPKGLIILSGALINKAEWRTLIPNRKGQSYFISHGTEDTILPMKTASQLEGLLNGGGMKGGLVNFQGGHEIPLLVIRKMSEYLSSLNNKAH